MLCFTLHSNQQLVNGIICTKTLLEPDKPAWSIWTGSPHPMGIMEVTHYPITDRMSVFTDPKIGFIIQSDHGCHDANTLLIKNQSPIGGAWAMELLGQAEIISSGYIPKTRGVAQGEGAEYLLNLPVQSLVKIALCGNTKGQPKYYTIRSLDHGLSITPSNHFSFVSRNMDGTQEGLFKETPQWPN